MKPRPAWFDPDRNTWTLSRYGDVLAAFREPLLWTIGTSGEERMEVRDVSGRLTERAAMQEALSHPKVVEWQTRFEPVVNQVLSELPKDRPVDLLSEVSRPCCLQLAALITGVATEDIARLGELSFAAFGGTGAAAGSAAQLHARTATEEMKRYFESSAFRMGEPTFVGTSQTTARLLATGWLALLSHPAECERLRRDSGLIVPAVEELLRYAGIVPTLYRKASAAVEIGPARIVEGQRVDLQIAAANRDPEQFPDPDRLDVGRRAVNHLALGSGRNSCVGNLVIRMASAVTMRALLAYPGARVAGEIEWQTTPSFSWPLSVPVVLGTPTVAS